ncbi:hypothetical protein [Rhodanobacter denitrificans]|uniref:hypothetical protein n=1 Tax=Rhodanobacter denitrificans TaxID=666685 RepID=UPI001F413C19|nr:hypothetical protein [Rhodanobacter denitrificans]UJJ60619.1 hypothetical protein LRK55_19485 [Rhodanobacter denitrificans]
MEDESSPYAPIRLRRQSYFQFARAVAQSGQLVADGRISASLHHIIERDLITPQVELVMQGYRSGEIPPDAIGPIFAKQFSYSDWVPLVGQYELCGRQIFDLHEALTELLRHTDTGECTLEDIHFPYPCIYIHFGKLLDVRQEFDSQEGTYEYMDGVFVALTPWGTDGGERIKMGFSTVHEDGTGVMYPGLFFDLRPEERILPVDQAIEAALARRHAAHQAAHGATDAYQAMMSYVREADLEAADTLRQAASLVVNALFYLESLRDHLPPAGPGRDTPPTLVAKWAASNPRQRIKQRSALSAEGYAVVHLVGAEVESPSTTTATGTNRKVHWRRGHWRQQAYGERMSLRRRTWIKPVLVGAGDGMSTDLPGHVYVMGTSDHPQ